MSAAQLGRELRVSKNHLIQLIAGKGRITEDIAKRLGQWFGTGPELWLNLQQSFEFRLAEQEAGAEKRRTTSTRAQTGGSA